MYFATISADVISYTSLNEIEKRNLEESIHKLIDNLGELYKNEKFYGRLIQGDYIEFALNEPTFALRIALLLKAFVKSLSLEINKKDKTRLKHFSEHGIRLAIAIAPLETFKPEKGIIDGEAIYLSGRAIKRYSTSNKQKVVIKNTMYFCSSNEKIQNEFDVILALLDTIFTRFSPKQSEVIYLKLLGYTEKEIASKLEKYQSTISQHSTAAGWLAIEKAVNYFENYFNHAD
ncbi:hypothetical protein [Saccharicrinis fermentans]|uniref:RNA polymerase sigma factor n=1 Tax=Saccharicrinis fermentans DSM 9555 = JCM 21142 TaxID=869213 RepID=W7YI86_9BACT|nr:hypothetical protein [Saccharicrinis fermentans]GAF02274.1 RNA polymerase sigma factor [Saccharicrinis fermentans DSM 9555 = JCM 21142]